MNNSASLRYGAVGFPTKVRAMLFNDHIELHDKRDNILLDTPLANLSNAKVKWNSMITFTANGRYYSLDFTPLARQATFGAFGALGSIVGMATNPAGDTAHTWLSTITRNY